jgi:hypothetical protein
MRVVHQPGTATGQLLAQLGRARYDPPGHLGEDQPHRIRADDLHLLRPRASVVRSLLIGQDRYTGGIAAHLAPRGAITHGSPSTAAAQSAAAPVTAHAPATVCRWIEAAKDLLVGHSANVLAKDSQHIPGVDGDTFIELDLF